MVAAAAVKKEAKIADPDKALEHRCCFGCVPYKYLALITCVLLVGLLAIIILFFSLMFFIYQGFF